MGNLRSVEKAFERLGVATKISSRRDEIITADKLILPGVGNFKRGMSNIKRMGLFDVLNTCVLNDKKATLGICLGMQLMTNFSTEGDSNGFGWINAETISFKEMKNIYKLKIPHMGWNNTLKQKESALLKNISDKDLFYFVHSYYIRCENESDILTQTLYGDYFVSSFNAANIHGCQFHPEKSHDAGLTLLKNFAEI